jgi:hypothetical protein
MAEGTKTSLERRPRFPRGHRPNNLGDAHVERVLSIAMAVATEVSALHDRLDTVARLAGKGEPFTMEAVDKFEPSVEVSAEREKWRHAYLERLLRIMWEEIPVRESDERKMAYESFVEEIAQ